MSKVKNQNTKIKVHKDVHKYRHPFHLVSPSPWPFFTSIALFTFVLGFVLYMHTYILGGIITILGFISLIICLIGWWGDVLYESVIQGAHTIAVQSGLRIGFMLFIVSEVMFFSGFFFTFFYVSLSPSVDIGAIWPPAGIDVLDPLDIPLLNTLILLLSGFFATCAHHIFSYTGRSLSLVRSKVIISEKKDYTNIATHCLIFAILLGGLFTLLQGYEYFVAPFSMSDGIYGSIFYMATGFHGLHVIIGTLFLGVVYVRALHNHFTGRHYFAVEAAVWYWHFVDVVWLFLYVSIYWWGA
jgi:heme/copper-type cytochrome/quinol oxidase subunit 3